MKILLVLFLALMPVACTPAGDERPLPVQSISGKIINGYRIINLPPTGNELSLTVYRGDYIKFQSDESAQNSTLSIPALNIHQKLSFDLGEAPYFKMKVAGSFAFSIGDVTGTISIIEYDQPNYREVTAVQAAEIIKHRNPLILDVRTPREFKRGHLKGALLIPVQELQARVKELSDYKGQEILIYCATGNRSTVASKILNDNGYNPIINMRYGIVGWQKDKLPVHR